jgi:FkbM family methyltransferase
MTELSISLGKRIVWSKKSFLQRFIKHPVISLYKAAMVRIAEKILRSGIRIKMKTFFGERMTGYLPDGNSLFMWGFIPGEELNLTQAILSLSKKGDNFFDVGAHFGYYTLLASKLVSKDGTVHAFEPTPRTFEILKNNCVGHDNVFLNQSAVMDSPGILKMKDFGPRYASRNTFLKETIDEKARAEKNIREFECHALTIDSYCESKKVLPNFMKIDAEGAEFFILKGAEKILKKSEPIITIEVWGGKNVLDESIKAIKYLESLGYEANTWENNKLLPHDGDFNFSYKNFIFLKKYTE